MDHTAQTGTKEGTVICVFDSLKGQQKEKAVATTQAKASTPKDGCLIVLKQERERVETKSDKDGDGDGRWRPPKDRMKEEESSSSAAM